MRRVAHPLRHAVAAPNYVELKNGSHGVLWTHADQINSELLAFLK